MATLLEADKIFYTPYEPKLKNRYIFEIQGIPAFTIKTAQRPQITFDEVTLEHMNITKYVKGREDGNQSLSHFTIQLFHLLPLLS